MKGLQMQFDGFIMHEQLTSQEGKTQARSEASLTSRERGVNTEVLVFEVQRIRAFSVPLSRTLQIKDGVESGLIRECNQALLLP